MTKTQGRQVDAGVLAVFYRTDTTLHALVARIDGARPRITASRDFALSEAAHIDDWLDRESVAEAIEILPAASVVCRNCVLPEGDPTQLDQALALQAEVTLGSTPAHRLGMAVLDQAPGETTRTGVLVSWPESAEHPAIATEIPVRYASDVAAIAALMDGHRPDDPIVAIDRSTSSVALGLAHSGGAALRAARAEMENEDWPQQVGRLIAETGLSSNHSATFVESIVRTTTEALGARLHDTTRLLLPDALRDEARARVEGSGSDDRWWERYGLAVGVLLARSGALRGLTNLRAAAPIEKPDILSRITDRISNPRTAVHLVVACLLLLAFGPPAFNFARWKILELRNPNLNEELALYTMVSQKRDIYSEVKDDRWSMTKLLADLACNTPQGIQLDQVRIDHGESVTVNGKVQPFEGEDLTLTSQEVVQRMQSQLLGSGLFTKVAFHWGDGNYADLYEFDLTAEVAKPHRAADYDVGQDFGVWTLQERENDKDPGHWGPWWRDGDSSPPDRLVATAAPDDDEVDSGETAPVETASDATARRMPGTDEGSENEDEVSGRAPDRPRPRPSTSGSGRSLGGGDVVGGGISAQNQIPNPLTQEQVDAMSKSEARVAMAEVAKAKNNAKGTDDELHARLTKDFDMLLERLKKRE